MKHLASLLRARAIGFYREKVSLLMEIPSFKAGVICICAAGLSFLLILLATERTFICLSVEQEVSKGELQSKAASGSLRPSVAKRPAEGDKNEMRYGLPIFEVETPEPPSEEKEIQIHEQ